MPKPKRQFQRPTIDLGSAWTTPKEWKQHPVKNLSVGDIVADAGLVVEIDKSTAKVKLTFPSGSEWLGEYETTLFAYSTGRG